MIRRDVSMIAAGGVYVSVALCLSVVVGVVSRVRRAPLVVRPLRRPCHNSVVVEQETMSAHTGDHLV